MIKINFQLILFLLILCSACKTSEESLKDIFVHRVNIKLNATLKMSEFADSIRFIPLSGDVLLRDVDKLLLDDDENMYIIDSRDDGVFKFDKSGNFIKQISRRGQGPGEYTEISDFDIYDGKLLINDIYKQFYYTLNGEFIEETKERHNVSLVWVNDTICDSSGAQSLSVFINGNKNRYFKQVFTDNDLMYMHPFHLTKNGDEIYWEDCYNDTIYRITDGRPSPFLYVDFGDLKLPDDIIIDNNITRNERAQRYCTDISGFKISDDYISFAFGQGKQFYACIYNRRTNTPYVYNWLHNDINVAPLILNPFYIKGKTLYFVTNADMIYQYYTALKESTEKDNQQMATRLLETVGGRIDEMDNPFIVAVTCK